MTTYLAADERDMAEMAIRETLAFLGIRNPRADKEWIPAIIRRLDSHLGPAVKLTAEDVASGALRDFQARLQDFP